MAATQTTGNQTSTNPNTNNANNYTTASEGNLFQGSALPATVTTTEQQQTAPDFYTNYLQDIANLGQNAVTQGGVAGFSPLQQQAFQMAPQAAFAGANSLNAAQNALGTIDANTAANLVGNYMNPFTKDVLNANELQSQQNIQRNILPALASAGVGTGSFGSSRMANATGQSLADIQSQLGAQNANLLNTGYNQSMQNAQTGIGEQLTAGQQLNALGTEQNALAQAGLNQLSNLGGQQQAFGQKVLCNPMAMAQNFSKLMGGYNIPMGEVNQVTAPGQQGNFSNSPLSQIAGLGTLIAALYGQPTSPTTTAGK